MDRWLDTIGPRQFDEHVAFDRMEPDELRRIRDILKLGFAAISGGWCGAALEPDYFDPPAMQEKEKKQPEVSPNEAVATVKMLYGTV